MCGRYALTAAPQELIETFDVPALDFDYEPRDDVAPGQLCPVVAEDRHGRRMGLLEWGFLPGWKDEPRGAFINARAESVATKASFREAFSRRRCLVPADGFYEWGPLEPSGGKREPHWVSPSDGRILSFAGIWETWRRPGFEPRHGFAIITTEANAEVGTIHDRMPVVVEAADRGTWLDRAASLDTVGALLRASPDEAFTLEPRAPGGNGG